MRQHKVVPVGHFKMVVSNQFLSHSSLQTGRLENVVPCYSMEAGRFEHSVGTGIGSRIVSSQRTLRNTLYRGIMDPVL